MSSSARQKSSCGKRKQMKKSGRRFAVGAAAAAFLGASVSDGKRIDQWDRPPVTSLIEISRDIPSYRPVYEVAILRLYACSSTGMPHNVTVHTGIDDYGGLPPQLPVCRSSKAKIQVE